MEKMFGKLLLVFVMVGLLTACEKEKEYNSLEWEYKKKKLHVDYLKSLLDLKSEAQTQLIILQSDSLIAEALKKAEHLQRLAVESEYRP